MIADDIELKDNFTAQSGIDRGRNLAGAGTKLNQPGPGLAKICRGRGWDFFNLILKIFESFRKLVSM